jgi:hypothetical protein
VVGLAAAVLGVSASTARAENSVWLWACHGPDGASVPLRDGVSLAGGASESDAGCADRLGTGAIELALAGDRMTGRTGPTATFGVPSGLELSQVKLRRTTSGFSGPEQADNARRYIASTAGGELERVALDDAPADLDGELDTAAVPKAAGDQLTVSLKCDVAPCPATGPVNVHLSRVGLHVTETSAANGGRPSFALGGWNNFPSGVLTLDVQATDHGAGLRRAEAWLDGTSVTTVDFGGMNCRDLTPATSTVDLPLDADCPKVANTGDRLKVDTTQVPDGPNTLHVRVTDWAGKTTQVDESVSVLNHPVTGSRTQTLQIATSGSIPVPIPSGTTPSGGVAGASSTSCRSPRLSMELAQKPLRIRKHRPVLRAGKRYRFKGRLTCVVNGKRRAAPKRTRVDIFNKIGKKTYVKSGVTVRRKGRISIILAYRSSRTIIFRFINTDGQRSQVSIKIRVQKKKHHKRQR